MAKVYINKGREGQPWKGACVINDDESMDLMGLFGVAVHDPENQTLVDQVRNEWRMNPDSNMMQFDQQNEPDEIGAYDEATPEQIKEALSGTYVRGERLTIPAPAPVEEATPVQKEASE